MAGAKSPQEDMEALSIYAPTIKRGVLHLPLTRFRDTEDTIPQPHPGPSPLVPHLGA